MSGLCQDAASFAASAVAGDETIAIVSAAELAAEVGGQLPPPLAFADIDDDLSGDVQGTTGWHNGPGRGGIAESGDD